MTSRSIQIYAADYALAQRSAAEQGIKLVDFLSCALEAWKKLAAKQRHFVRGFRAMRPRTPCQYVSVKIDVAAYNAAAAKAEDEPVVEVIGCAIEGWAQTSAKVRAELVRERGLKKLAAKEESMAKGENTVAVAVG